MNYGKKWREGMKSTTVKNILSKAAAAAMAAALIAGADARFMNGQMTTLHAAAATAEAAGEEEPAISSTAEAAGEEEPSPSVKNDLMKNAASDLAAKYGAYLESASQTANDMREEALKAVKEEDAAMAQEWLDTLVEQFDENDIQGSAASSFTEETSEEEMLAALQLLSAVYQGEISTEILSFDKDGFVARLTGDNVSGVFPFTFRDGMAVLSGSLFTSMVCGTCGGAGQIPSYTTCAICGGTGQQYIANAYYDMIMGWQGMWQACGGCGGAGQFVNYSICPECGGAGVHQ